MTEPIWWTNRHKDIDHTMTALGMVIIKKLAPTVPDADILKKLEIGGISDKLNVIVDTMSNVGDMYGQPVKNCVCTLAEGLWSNDADICGVLAALSDDDWTNPWTTEEDSGGGDDEGGDGK